MSATNPYTPAQSDIENGSPRGQASLRAARAVFYVHLLAAVLFAGVSLVDVGPDLKGSGLFFPPTQKES